jgi:hypothetical protein
VFAPTAIIAATLTMRPASGIFALVVTIYHPCPGRSARLSRKKLYRPRTAFTVRCS